jgi:hypothetical protein
VKSYVELIVDFEFDNPYMELKLKCESD